ncbi:DUF349 domain-containing protein [Fodinibius saliphilus]|uniref:DUF349 domain-containing protein n=1 Tax=Fodinibius saliphilus TaxID=1920650 RepID=UPI001107FAAF|nr:DUF349 domain-containing protein [Fodinibius saliphilus]
MNTTMEEKEKTSEFLYEDEYVFLTENNELFLKDGGQGDQRKLCEVPANQVEEKIANFKGAFSALEEKVEQAISDQEVTSELLASLKKDVQETVAIGDFDSLLSRIDEAGTVDKESSEEDTEKAKEDVIEEENTGEAEEPTEELSNEENDEDPVTFYRNIISKAQELAEQDDWSYVSGELNNLSHKWADGPTTDSEKVKKLFQKFNKIVDDYEEKKEAYYKKQKEKRQQNLETKKKLLKEFEGIVSNETWTATKRVGQMKQQWNSTGPLPSGKGEELDERFEELLDTFNEHKVDRLVQKRQKEEDNLMLKLTVLEKMENVAESINHETTEWDELEEQFEDLTKQWKKIGRVPKDKANNVWERYKAAQDKYYDQKYKHDPEHQSKVDRFYHKKEKLCEEAEALLEEDDLAIAARKINKLHRRWKKVGNLPQRTEDKLWNRFKAATDAFNEKKSNNRDKIEELEEEHYQQKLELIDKANAIKETDDFEKGHSKMQSYMDRWKKIGPVPRKKSNKIWKKFKGAMDEFYDRRREHFKEVKEERKENLKKKKEILEELRELGSHEDPIKAVDLAKDLQEKFKNVGYVPIKHKNKMWKQYREVCDVIYDRMRAAKSGDKFDQELAKADLNPEDRNQIQELRKEYKAIKKEVRSLEKEALQYEEKKTYFKPTNGGNSLLDEVEKKIENIEEEIEQKRQKMEDLTDQMDDIREGSVE